MILADDIMLAVGGENDVGGFMTSVAKTLQEAERFVLSDDVANAGYDLISSKPSSLLDAMSMCRVPYPIMWLEWNGSASGRVGWDLLPYTEKVAETPEKLTRRTPVKLGCLIESRPADKGTRGSMTWLWKLPDGRGLSAGGLCIMFDFTGHVREWGRSEIDDRSPYAPALRHWSQDANDETLVSVMQNSLRWKALAKNQFERDALRKLSHYEMPWISRHATGWIDQVARHAPDELHDVIRAWTGDICGEAPFVDAIILMMNSKNAVEHQTTDLSKLNKARAKHKRPLFLSHRVTHIHLSKTRAKVAAAAGMTRAEARAHLVRGHFKIRKSGVYWWSSFLRGTKGNPYREHYDVR